MKKSYLYTGIILYWVIILILISYFSLANLRGFLKIMDVPESNETKVFIHYIVSDYQILEALLFALILGAIFIITNEAAEKLRIERYSFGKIIIFKTSMYIVGAFVSFFVVFLIISQFEFFPKDMFDLVVQSGMIQSVMSLVILFVIIQTIIMNYFIQTMKKFGLKSLSHFISGKYYHPVIENRIFLFLDLRSSTTHAEQLGNVVYSLLLKDCFNDINKVIEKVGGEIYQYVGDEVVITWEHRDGICNATCIALFFECKKYFEQRAHHYLNKYGFVPMFKGGLHGGEVTVTEIGNLKRDIAYHGDVLNTASRIQDLCNTYEENLLISEDLLKHIELPKQFSRQHIGEIQLRGKSEKISVMAVKSIITEGSAVD